MTRTAQELKVPILNTRFHDTLVIAQDVLSKEWLDRINQKANLSPGRVLAHSKYFSKLKTYADFVLMVDSLQPLVQVMLDTGHRHVEQLEVAKTLFVRWYCYGERSVGIHDDINQHLRLANSYGDLPNTLSRHESGANFSGMSDQKFLTIRSMRESLLSTSEMLHITGTFGLSFLTPTTPIKERVANLGRCLGLIRQPTDFVHYVNAEAEPEVEFTQPQIDYVVKRSLDFGYDLLTYAASREERNWTERQQKSLRNLRARLTLLGEKSGEAEAVEVGQQLLIMAERAQEVEANFLAFATGWLGAVNTTFKRHS